MVKNVHHGDSLYCVTEYFVHRYIVLLRDFTVKQYLCHLDVCDCFHKVAGYVYGFHNFPAFIL